jgi:hypothetical protein
MRIVVRRPAAKLDLRVVVIGDVSFPPADGAGLTTMFADDWRLAHEEKPLFD